MSEFWEALAKARNEVMAMSLALGLLVLKRQGKDTWTDVATLNHINEKLAEVRKMVEDYAKIRGAE